MQSLKAFLRNLSDTLPDEEIEKILPHVAERRYGKGSYFTQLGDTHDLVGVVVSGLFKVSYLSHDGEEHIRNFCREGSPIGSYATILQGQSAHVNIEALEESVVIQLHFKALAALYSQHIGWERLGRRLAEDHYIAREKREYQFLVFNAQERLRAFSNDFPGLEKRTTKSNIASYIGVKPETLSRLLSKT